MQPETQTGAHSLLQSWAREMDVVLAGFCVTSHSCRAAHETAVAGLNP